MGNYAVPEHIRKLKPIGTMVKIIKGNYYVYEYFCRKNDKGNWSTKMGKLLGTIDETIGFIPNDNYTCDDEITTLEYGQYVLTFSNSQNTLKALLDVFNPEDAYRIYLIAVIHFVNGFTYLKNIKEYFDQSYFSLKFSSLNFGYRSLVTLIDALGRKQNKVMQFEQQLIDNSSKKMAIDGHVIRSTSHDNDLGEYGNKYPIIKDMQINVLMAYDIQTNQPLLSRVYEGGTLDKVSIRDIIDRHFFKNTLFIVDRGFYSQKNIEAFSENNNKYIIPLSSNLKSYKEAMKSTGTSGVFVYEKNKKMSMIECKDVRPDDKTRIVIYRDVNQNALERADYMKNIESGNKKYTMEGYEKVKEYFGVIVLQTNMMNETVQEIFEYYKKRCKIETFYNYFKNIDYNALKLSDYYLTQGLSFIMLIVGLIHRELGEAVKSVKGKSIDDCLLETRFVKINKIHDIWKVTNMKKSLRELMETLNIDCSKGIEI